MRLNELRINGLRNISGCSLTLSKPVVLLVGGNGAGKSAVLEALFLLGRGRSFRSTNNRGLIKSGVRECTIFARVKNGSETHRLGLSRTTTAMTCRIDGEAATLSQAASMLPVQIMEPGGVALLDAQPASRRRWLDWGVFHVEQDFYAQWRSYKRILGQRNAALRGRRSVGEISSWDAALCANAEMLTKMRDQHTQELTVEFGLQLSRMGLGFQDIRLRYRDGGLGRVGLLDELRKRAPRDRELQTTTAGPHRGDFEVLTQGINIRTVASRGEQKLLVLALMLAQAKSYTLSRGHAPILLFDDLFSELDEAHQKVALEAAMEIGAQTIITALSMHRFAALDPHEAEMFHVEQGVVRLATNRCPAEETRD